MTVLVIDDEEFVIVTVTKCSSVWDMPYWQPNIDREVADLLHRNQNKIDMVIMDMVMPDMHPDQILSAIRAVIPEPKSCFQVVTASAVPAVRAMGTC